MARFTSSFAILLAFITTSIATVPAGFENNIANIASQVTDLDNAFSSFSTSGVLSIMDALKIHGQIVTLVSTLSNATAGIAGNTSVLDEADGQRILTDIEPMTQTVISALQGLVDREPEFNGLLRTGVRIDLADLQNGAKAFEDGIIARTPPNLLAQAASMTSAVDAAYATAIVAFAAT